jgi:hypothetical protein
MAGPIEAVSDGAHIDFPKVFFLQPQGSGYGVRYLLIAFPIAPLGSSSLIASPFDHPRGFG